jgi:23S rRNA pseudouridine1911/1915/1917 synthase
MAGAGARAFTFVVGPEDEGKRLDQVLAARVPELSRRRARVLLDLGGVFVDDTRAKQASRPVSAGQKVVAHLGGALARATNQVGQEARARDEEHLPSYAVIHEDDDLLVVDKPAGLLTAPTPESDRNNLAGLLSRRHGPREPLFVVHRIDLDTSGLLVFARTPDANQILSETFRRHDLTRSYLAVGAGAVPDTVATIDRPIDGRRAVTHVVSVERLAAPATLLRLRLETGRTHQIRLHLQSLGHPVLGDRQHGRPTPIDPPRMALHATQLAFRHPITGAALDFNSPWPADLAAWLEGLRQVTG